MQSQVTMALLVRLGPHASPTWWSDAYPEALQSEASEVQGFELSPELCLNFSVLRVSGGKWLVRITHYVPALIHALCTLTF